MARLRRYYGRVVTLTKDKRFIQLGDTHIKDTLTGEEWYAPCEDSLLSLLNELFDENERLKNKLNTTALELVGECISMGKAVEISEMSYREFIDYRAENGKPMELQL